MRQKLIDTLTHQFSQLFEGAPELPGQREMQQQIRSVVQSTFARLDLVTRDEFDAQSAVLARTRELVETLEQRVAELEQNKTEPDTPAPASDNAAE
jgi:BMFP domain-containing protein YqiC